MQEIAQQERQLQLQLRAMTNGVPSERDRLLSYGIAEFYQELSLFIEEGERREKELKELKAKL